MHSQDALVERWDQVFTALSSDVRRTLLLSLADVPPDRRVLLPEAAASSLVATDREALTVELRQHHLPLLADCGYVEWTSEPFRAARGEAFEDVAVILETLLASASALPDELVMGCGRLEERRNG